MFRTSAFLTVTGLVLGLAGPLAAEDLQWTLINNTDTAVVEFYTSPTTTNDWQSDVLSNDVLEPGATATVTIADGETVCDYDLKFVFKDGSTLEDTVNMCEMGSYTLQN
ncbi:MAG: hypothetical protein GC146_07255 [Limimaricola sp.]|uniref:hypothetical protein n=1 Tax=Limimaricola sp. TaxID=2211665 RepID=UPI001D90C01E|nr:hypothetical protein [Limimaricola sp.]MBI1417001.1 hypothetical protein [Limimaricola sp.]